MGRYGPMAIQDIRKKLSAGTTLWAAGAYDALSARMIDDAGFDVVFSTGFGISASLLGQPDVELYTMTENLSAVRQMVNCVSPPGHRRLRHRLWRNRQRAPHGARVRTGGVAGLVIEDQEMPKRCPAIASAVAIAPLAEAVAKIRAALDAAAIPIF